MDDINNIFLNLITEKEQQFILLTMERIKEEDKEYLKTLHKEQLIKLRDNIKNICNNILDIDKKIIEICNDIKKKLNDENDIKLFKHYLDLNDNLNSYLSMLMSIPLNSIEIYKLYENHNFELNKIFYRNNPELLKALRRSPQKTPNTLPPIPPRSPPNVSPKLLKAPNTSPLIPLRPPPIPPRSPSNVSPELDKFIELKQCNITSILARDSDYPFLNAIFEYGMYKKQLHIIYNRLIEYYYYIDNIDYDNVRQYIGKKKFPYNIFMDMSEINNNILYHDFNYNFNIKSENYKNIDNKDCFFREYTHNDINNTFYETNLNNFIYCMNFLHNLYIHTLGKNDFLNDIKNYLNTNNIITFEKAGWNVSIIDDIMKSYNDYRVYKTVIHTDILQHEKYYNSILKNYIEIANTNKIINIKIIEKIFSEKILEIERFYITYTIISIPYEQFHGKKKLFTYFKNSKKNNIRIIQDSNNKYFNIFSIE